MRGGVRGRMRGDDERWRWMRGGVKMRGGGEGGGGGEGEGEGWMWDEDKIPLAQ